MLNISSHPVKKQHKVNVKYEIQKRRQMKLSQERLQQRTHLHPDAMINTEPEEQQRTEEESLKESIQRSWKPAVH